MSILIRKIASLSRYYSTINREIRRIQKLERYTLGKSLKLFDNEVFFSDNLSFLWQYEDIFAQEIYKFKSSDSSPLIIDCGANIGLSLVYFKLHYPKSRIVAFEPNPNVLEVCHSNIKSFNLKDIALHNHALWNEEKTILLECDKADGSFISEQSSTDTIEVKSVKLSDYINEPTELLKIDIEGAEYEVLKESEPKLNLVKNIFIEYHSRADSVQNLHQLLDILADQGFRYHIKSTGILNPSPFIRREIYNGYDNFLNIYAFRT
jgi:FkbM family methyltransferase